MAKNNELSFREKQRIRKLVKKWCANYDTEYGCLPLDCDCYMFGICYRNSGLCRYFREALLPTDPVLQSVFQPAQTRNCQLCGRAFPAEGTRAYCSRKCRDEARKRQTAERVRQYRSRHRQ